MPSAFTKQVWAEFKIERPDQGAIARTESSEFITREPAV
jgi:hypothetical protein